MSTISSEDLGQEALIFSRKSHLKNRNTCREKDQSSLAIITSSSQSSQAKGLPFLSQGKVELQKDPHHRWHQGHLYKTPHLHTFDEEIPLTLRVLMWSASFQNLMQNSCDISCIFVLFNLNILIF